MFLLQLNSHGLNCALWWENSASKRLKRHEQGRPHGMSHPEIEDAYHVVLKQGKSEVSLPLLAYQQGLCK
eukprot:4022058-Amphidinium_carterae.1